MKLKDKTIIITGGASGIGKATAILFIQNGANVVIIDSNKKELLSFSSEFKYENILVENADIRFSDQIKRIVQKAIELFGKIDILFNNAGVERNKEIQDLTEEDWDFVLDTNLKAPFLCSKLVIPNMIEKGGGVIIHNSSKMAELALEKASAYCSSKSGLLGLTKAMALDLAKYNIRVNAILPGSVDTPLMWEGVSKKELTKVKSECAYAIPIKRVADPKEIALFVKYLVSDEASYITGSCLTIDGGLGAKLATIK